MAEPKRPELMQLRHRAFDVTTICSYTIYMRKARISKKSGSDWKRLDSMKDEEIDVSDIPQVTPEMFARGIVRRGLKPVIRKKQLTLRVDSDVVEWYQKQGPGYQTRVNSLLRAYMEEHLKKRA
jgi:uncharacterized protein (DUF4415 family)